MIFRFNVAQLGREMESQLKALLTEFQKSTEVEIEILVVDFPKKFSVKVGDDVSVVKWSEEDSEFRFLVSPEPEPTPEPVAEIEKPEPGPDRSDEGIRILACDTFEILKSMNAQQRSVFWAEFSAAAMKELN